MTVRGKWLAAFGLPLAAGLASAGYQAVGEARDRWRFPPPGELIDVGGRRLHMWRMGTGTPVVIIPALGGEALEWASIQRELASVTTVYIYDRAGLAGATKAHVDRPRLVTWPLTCTAL